ncbi:SigB/SigF/SigG family RNA polymerase sigma factor [Cryptosporangium minutisporangium]|uniref:SigB/SigF/SigG family RNA polymerase sigma factor n=1 Tax=Cryptosporangium minutisporangium TaxID=113569 RepID=A0ABP6T1V6_9ACTN
MSPDTLEKTPDRADRLAGTRPDPAVVDGLFVRLAGLAVDDRQRGVVRDALVTEYLSLARNLAWRFRDRGEPLDDLVQVARVGLIKAVDRFDPGRGIAFPVYAIPTITGELRRHFRDRGWDVRVPRRLQELHLQLRAATQELSHRTGRAPTAGELATYLRLPREQVIEGLQAGDAYTAGSLDRPSTPRPGAPTLGDLLPDLDRPFERVDDHEALAPLVAALPPRERRILYLRFVEEQTQTQIAQEIGVSQMHVSRLLSATLAQLRKGMFVPG